MNVHLGYYAHHHGRGHVQRAAAIAHHLGTPATLLTSAPAGAGEDFVDVVHLDPDVGMASSGARCAPLPDVLHYGPVGVPGLRRRIARLATWFATADPAIVVVDVSVEVTLLVRMAGIVPVVVRQHGRRADPAHRAAYASAGALLAPWPAWLEDDTFDEDLRRRTWYVGGFSRFDGRILSREDARASTGLDGSRRQVVVLWGAGGTDVDLTDVAEAARHTPDWEWTVLDGRTTRPAVEGCPGVRVAGRVDDPFPWLRAADVVVSHGGHNAVMEAVAARARLVVVPATRPFDEQVHKARLLARTGVAVAQPQWPAPASWPRVLAQAADLSTARHAELLDGHGAARAAAQLDRLVEQVVA